MVKPIAFADNLAKTPLAERVNQLQKTAPDTDQRQSAQIAEAQRVQKHREAQPTEKTDEAIIHRDKQHAQQEHKEKKQEKDTDKEKKNGLDVTG